MAFRAHLLALLDAEIDLPDLRGRRLGPWQVGIVPAWGLSANDVDWQLARATRARGGLAIRASTVDDAWATVALFRDGRRIEIFEHPLDGLRLSELEDALATAGFEVHTGEREAGDPDPVAILGEIPGMDDEILARVRQGGSLSSSWAAATAGRAERLATTLRTAGAEPDRDRLLALLRGEAEASSAPDDALADNWVDVPEVFEAFGVAGVREWIAAAGEENDDEDVDDESVDDQKRGWSAGRIGCAVLALVVLAGAVGGGFLGRGTGSWLAVVGGVGLGATVPILLVLLGWAVRSLWSWWSLFRHRLRHGKDEGQWEWRVDLTSRLEPSQVPAVRLLLADWSDVTEQLRPHKIALSFLRGLYGDAILPDDSGGRALVERLCAGEDPAPLVEKVAAFRLRLLDSELAGKPVDRFTAELRILVDELTDTAVDQR